jgi:hypothetical protein
VRPPGGNAPHAGRPAAGGAGRRRRRRVRWVRRVARLVASFHERADTSPEIVTAAPVDAGRRNWEDNFRQMAPFAGSVLDREMATSAERLARRYLEGRRPLFDHRIASGMVRDGHGDLLAEDIFLLDDGPRVLDCIEFNDRLRYGDVLGGRGVPGDGPRAPGRAGPGLAVPGLVSRVLRPSPSLNAGGALRRLSRPRAGQGGLSPSHAGRPGRRPRSGDAAGSRRRAPGKGPGADAPGRWPSRHRKDRPRHGGRRRNWLEPAALGRGAPPTWSATLGRRPTTPAPMATRP